MARADVMAGRAYVSLYAKRDLLTRELQAARADVNKFGSDMMTLGAKVAGVGAAMLAPIVASVKLASDFEESFSKFSIVFGDAAEGAKQWSDDFAFAVGRSRLQIVQFMASTQDLFVPIGFEPKAAEEMSKQLTTLAVDLASFNNMQDADTLRDLHAALTGSGEVMKKYGVLVSEAAVKQELLNQGMDPTKANEQQKVQARLAIIMQGTTAAQGDAIRTAGSFANQMKALRSSVIDVAVEVGSVLLPVLSKVVGVVRGVTQRLAAIIKENPQSVLMFAALAVAVTAAGGAMIAIGIAAKVAAVGIGAVVAVITGVSAVFGFVLSPIGLVVAALAGGVYAWVRFSEAGRTAAGGLRDVLSRAFGTISQTVKETFGGIYEAIKSGDMALAGQIAMIGVRLVFAQGLEALTAIFGETLGALAAQLLSGDFAGAWSTLGAMILDSMAGVASGMVELFSNAANAVMAKWQQTVNKISDYILESASQGGVMGWALEQISGVNMQEEAARAARLNQQAGAMGLAQDAGVVTSAQYQDPALEAIKQNVAAAGEAAKTAMQSATNATGASLAESTSGATGGQSERVKALQDELAALQVQSGKKLEEMKAGTTGDPVKTGEGQSSQRIGKASSATFSAQSLLSMGSGAGQGIAMKQLTTAQKAVGLQQKSVELAEQTIAAIKTSKMKHA